MDEERFHAARKGGCGRFFSAASPVYFSRRMT
jgi:hypothetical protein